jgi:nitrogen fixation protein NifQ
MNFTLSPGCDLEPLPGQAVALFSGHPHTTRPDITVTKTIAGVMRNAQNGELPLFAWTLGLPQWELQQMVTTLFPELGPLEPLRERDYAILAHPTPPEFQQMADFLFAHRGVALDRRSAHWLARAIAAAVLGERHLWQDLELSGRPELSKLLERYFPTLHARNTSHLKWKRFLFAELGTTRGIVDMRPPGCGKCAQFTVCFPSF